MMSESNAGLAERQLREVAGAFPLERAAAQSGATLLAANDPMTFMTPAARWAYAMAVPAVWPPSASWIAARDGSIRVRLRVVDGCASVLALGASGNTIDEVIVEHSADPVDADLISAPLGNCRAIVVRNVRDDGRPSRVELIAVACHDLWDGEYGDALRAPDDLVLRADGEWSRYYGVHLPLAERVRAVRYASLDCVKTMPWLEDLTVRIHPNDDLSRALYISGLYEPSTMLALKRMVPTGGVFLDVGANAGVFSIVASRWVGSAGSVYAFEPSARELDRLNDHITLNGLTNVKVRHLAVGAAEGEAHLRVAPFPNAGHNTMGRNFAYEGVQTERIEAVSMTTMDRFVKEERLPRIDAIKMDVEGSEYGALSGCRSVLEHFRPVLVVEISRASLASSGATPEEVAGLLTAARYRMFRIGPGSELVPLAPETSIPEGDLVALPIERRDV